MTDAISVTFEGSSEREVSNLLINLCVKQQINEVPTATATLAVGNMASREFKNFDDDFYDVGKSLTILIRYVNSGDRGKAIFRGIITQKQLISKGGMTQLVIEVQDPAFRLKNTTKRTLFSRVNGHQMIEQMLTRHTGLRLQNSSTRLSDVTYFQHLYQQSTDWLFLMEQVKSNGLVLVCDNGQLQVMDLDQTQGLQTLDIGIDPVLDFSIRETATPLYGAVTINYWDVDRTRIEKLTVDLGTELSRAANMTRFELSKLSLTSSAQAQALIEGFRTSNELTQTHASITLPGDNQYQVMQQLQLDGVPTAFTGKHIISGVTQEVNQGRWQTKVMLGLDQYWQNPAKKPEQEMVHQEMAQVRRWERDPEGLGRIPVTLLSYPNDTYWAWPGQWMAGASQRSFRLPEENEWVTIGFLHEDQDYGVLLTSVYQKTAMPQAPFSFDVQSPIGWISRKNVRLLFEENDPSATLTTPGGQKFSLDDRRGADLKSHRNVTVEGDRNIRITARSGMQLKGRTIDLN